MRALPCRRLLAIALLLAPLAARAHGPVPPRLLDVPVPASPGLLDGATPLVVDAARAIELGKALFWDPAAGVDGVACATCHHHAGADSRVANQLAPGVLREGAASATSFEPTASGGAGGPEYRLRAADFPFTQRANPLDFASPITFSTDDVVSSAGVRAARWLPMLPRAPTRDRCRSVADPIFHADGVPARQVEPRNSPTVVNAAYNHRNFWDGRASNVFNGRTPWGQRDPGATIWVQQGGGVIAERLALANASLASQAVAPPLSNVEMSCDGRRFEDIARALLPRRPLERQRVHADDAVLGADRHASGFGLDLRYRELVEAAFAPRLWAGAGDFGAPAGGGPPWTHAEANFSLFFGLALQLYQATLIADRAPFDLSPRDAQEIPIALTVEERAGLEIFRRDHCGDCHGGATLTFAATDVLPLEAGGTGSRSNVDRTPITTGLALTDRGFANTGVVPSSHDPGLAGRDPFGRSFALADQYVALLGGGAAVDPIRAQACDFAFPFSLGNAFPAAQLVADPAGSAGCAFPVRALVPAPAIAQAEAALPGGGRLHVASHGAFKVPTLRNVELTGPYMHDGGMATLEQVVQFYSRGGNRDATSNPDLHAFVFPLNQTPAESAQLVAFLKTLTDERVRWERAPFDHPELAIPHGRDAAGREVFQVVPAVGAAGRTPEQGPLQPFHVLLEAE